MTTAFVQSIEVRKCRPPSQQLRQTIDPDALGALADDLAARGLLQPIGVRGPFADGEWEIMWGHRRWLAADQLGWTHIAAVLHPAATDPFAASVAENLQREQLTPLEEARIVGECRARGASVHTTARLLRRSVAWVQARLTLLDAPADVQQAAHEGKIPLGVAYALSAIDHPGYRADLIDQAHRLGATVAVAQVWAAEYARDRQVLITHHEGVAELIRRADQVRLTTTCRGCGHQVEWAKVEQLRLCPGCYAAVVQEAEGGGGGGSGGTELVPPG